MEPAKTLFRMGSHRETVVIKAAGGANMRGDDLFHTGPATPILRSCSPATASPWPPPNSAAPSRAA